MSYKLSYNGIDKSNENTAQVSTSKGKDVPSFVPPMSQGLSQILSEGLAPGVAENTRGYDIDDKTHVPEQS